ncbi:metabotropic glutamate receptor 3-like [Scylla paramamosain]|uniref:metabotropic glutamate receptor 3-like n=1 Tax=Scylla paramamosain TaxID=85552 RepID=UPI0030827D5C
MLLFFIVAMVLSGGGGGGGGSREVAAHSPAAAPKETQTEAALRKMVVYPKDATLYLGALFPIHNSEMDMTTGEDVCTYLQKREGIEALEALLFAVDEVNADEALLPGITLGVIVLDSCNSPSLALNQSLGFIKGFLAGQNQYHEREFTCTDGSTPVYRGGQFDKVVGVIGGQRSSVSVQIASVLRVIQLPQISYLSTSASLDNQQRYPFFLRTVPSDATQAQAILRIMSEFSWTHAGVVYSAEEYGVGGYRELSSRANQYNVCFASPAHKLAAHDSDDAYKRVVKELLKGDFKVVVVFAIREVAVRLLNMVKLSGHQDTFMWLGSDGWTYDTPMSLSAVAEGALAIQPLAKNMPGFDEYFTSLAPDTNTRNPWFQEYWQLRDSLEPARSQRPGARSLESEPKPSQASFKPYPHEPWLHFVRGAVMAFAHALHSMWEEECGGEERLCEAMAHGGHLHGHHLLQHLRDVSFTDLSNETFRFTAAGSGPARYTVFNYQKVQDYDDYEWIPVGSYFNITGKAPQLNLTAAPLKYRRGSDFPESSCGTPCGPTQERVPAQDSCCWSCKDCRHDQYYNTTEGRCHDCSECMLPDPGRQRCVPKEEKSIDYRSRWSITSLALASLGIFSTVLVGIIFWVHLETPVIKAASRELSYILLGGILLSFLMSFIIVAPPNKISCGLTRFFLGFSYSVCYAAVLTKISRISRIFNSTHSKNSHKARYTSPWSQVVIVVMLVSVEVVINVCWLVLRPPSTKTLCYPTTDYKVRICGGLDDYSYIVGLIYPLILVIFCTIYAIKTRKCPDGFNEARYITFTNYTTCIIWLIFVPLYLSAGVTDDIRVVTLALSLSLGGFVQLGCLFFPKVHVVLFKPEKNTRDAVMSVARHSSTRGDSVYKKQGPDHHSAPAVFVLNGGGHQNGAPPLSSPVPHPGLRDSPGRVNQVYMSTIHSQQEDMDYL